MLQCVMVKVMFMLISVGTVTNVVCWLVLLHAMGSYMEVYIARMPGFLTVWESWVWSGPFNWGDNSSIVGSGLWA